MNHYLQLNLPAQPKVDFCSAWGALGVRSCKLRLRIFSTLGGTGTPTAPSGYASASRSIDCGNTKYRGIFSSFHHHRHHPLFSFALPLHAQNCFFFHKLFPPQFFHLSTHLTDTTDSSCFSFFSGMSVLSLASCAGLSWLLFSQLLIAH